MFTKERYAVTQISARNSCETKRKQGNTTTVDLTAKSC